MTDLQKNVSKGDIHLNTAVHRREGGLPIGNGVTGSLLWTKGDTIGLQVNRVDVFANDSTTNSFNQRHSDYGFGCGQVDIGFYGTKSDAFATDGVSQHVDIYRGTAEISGAEVTCRAFAWTDGDVIVLKITDSRKNKGFRTVGIRMLRPPLVHTKSHTATSTFHQANDAIELTQHFTEDAYECSSALGVTVLGSDVRIREISESQLQFEIDDRATDFAVCIATAADFSGYDGPLAATKKLLETVRSRGIDTIEAESRSWWERFWERGFIYAESPDGEAEIIQQHYLYFLYLMASSSRDAHFPPNFGAMLWNTEGDMRSWGVQQWWNNLSLYYRELFASNRLELLDPLFEMYFAMYEAAETAARQQWGSKGIFIPETVWFNGLAKLPESIAEEMRDLYLFRKPWDERSAEFMDFASRKMPHSSRWNWKAVGHYDHGKWVFESKQDGPLGHVLHLFESNAKIAYMFWQRYEYTLDTEWLKSRAYPMLKGAAEFFRNFPHFSMEDDGKYHIRNVNNSEGVLCAKDTIEVMVALRGLLAVAIKAAEILGKDAELQELWREVLEHLAPIPDSTFPDALMKSAPGEPPFWVCGLEPAASAHDYIPISPILHFDTINLERAESEPELMEMAVNSYANRFPEGITPDTPIHVMWPFAIAAARMGYADDWRQAALNQIACRWPEDDFCYFDATGRDGVLENRMTLREGVNALGAERLGNAAFSLQLAVCQDAPPGPGRDPVIRLFPAWPTGWKGAFKLRCRGGFIVEAAIADDVVAPVTIHSEIGGTVRVRAPWESATAMVRVNDSSATSYSEPIIELVTSPGDAITITPETASH